MMSDEIKERTQSVREDVITWRRYLHKHPELSYQEDNTAQFVYDTLLLFGQLEVSRPTKTSVMARLLGNQPGRIIALRADMDALPIQEENTFDFASSNPGVMHACGHDGHTASLLGAARVLCGFKEQLKGEVRFIFQHAEELTPGGAEEMVAAGVMDGVDIIIANHFWSPLELGKVGIVYGPSMASPDTFKINLYGQGGHAAAPNETVDPIAIGSQVVTNLQHIVSRTTDPLDKLVVSVTQFIAGTADNVIPDSAFLCGTVRCYDQHLREETAAKIEQIVKGITQAHGATYEYTYEYGYRAVINDERTTRKVEETIRETFGDGALQIMMPSMGGEDFSAFLTKAPGTLFNVGAGNIAKGITYPHHHPRFTIDEDALEIAVQLFVSAAFKLLDE
jgi:amidohydrolase